FYLISLSPPALLLSLSVFRRLYISLFPPLSLPISQKHVPNIALLGSGGGERAAVGMLGSLHQLVQDNLLGSLLYMCGVSGTTWCMSTLYSDPSLSLSERCDEVIKRLKGPTVGLSKVVAWLKLRKEQNQDFNLTDFWGAFIASYFMKEVSIYAHRTIIKPYPIYSGVISDNFPPLFSVGVWFEMTPHESGFSGLGAFVPTSCLGSQFEGGIVREKRKEMDMVLLQGGECKHHEGIFLVLASADESKYMVTTGMKDKVSITNSWVPDGNVFFITFLSSMITMEGVCVCVCVCVCVFNMNNLKLVCVSPPDWWIVQNIFPLVQKWEWGTVYNFLFKIHGTKIHLVDAGLKINSPYPPVLRTSREVDLIISLDFSEGDPFETVFSAKQYADELKLPFPPVKESVRKEKEHPQDCYVFEGRRPEEPTIMHMPLFNLRNCQGLWEKYTTFQQHYDVSEIEHLLKKAKDNMRNNRDRILGQILLAVKRRKNRKSVAQ
uniref:PLA2c domain-containing protein n=1 Tax=Salmo trutta TaxID=8032 RepID=A0A673WXS5_SALTR